MGAVGATLIATPASPEVNYFGVMWAPIAPTPSGTPMPTSTPTQTQTPSNSPTPTASGTEGASPSNTVTGTPSSSVTSTRSASGSLTAAPTPSRTGTGSPSGSPSAYPVYGGMPFTQGSLVMLRVGDGAATLSSTGTAGAIVEMDLAGSILQTIALPTVSGVRDGVIQGSCVFHGTDTTQTNLATWPTGIAVGCYSSTIGGPTTAGNWRTVATINFFGEVSTQTVFSMGTSEFIRGIATAPDGSGFYIGGSLGLKYVAFGAQQVPATVLSTGTVLLRGMGVYQGNLYGAVATSPYGVSRLFDSPLPTSSNNITVLAQIMSGTSSSGSYTTNFHFDDTGALYVAN